MQSVSLASTVHRFSFVIIIIIIIIFKEKATSLAITRHLHLSHVTCLENQHLEAGGGDATLRLYGHKPLAYKNSLLLSVAVELAPVLFNSRYPRYRSFV
jgi:hypothetical protein